MRERGIQKLILERLSQEYGTDGLFKTRDNGNFVPLASIRSAVTQATRNPRQALAILKDLLTKQKKIGSKGEPDVQGVLRGQFVAIEVKKPSEKRKPHQVDYAKRIEMSGGIAVVATSPDEAVAEINQEMAKLSPR